LTVADAVPDPESRLVLVRRLIAEGLLRVDPIEGSDSPGSTDAGLGAG